MPTPVTPLAVRRAYGAIRPHVRRTPLLSGDPGSFGDARVTFKLELLQHAGSFKTRGAFQSLLSGAVSTAGVAAASGGNHGVAVAYAAKRLGHSATIFVPEIASPVKVAAIRAHGATVVIGGARYADAQLACDAHAATSGATVVHPFDSVPTLEGQGTVALEWEEDQARLGLEPLVERSLVALRNGRRYVQRVDKLGKLDHPEGQPPHGFIDDCPRHRVAVDVRVERVYAFGQHVARQRAVPHEKDAGFGRHVRPHADEGLDHREPLDLVIVVARLRLVRAQVQAGHHLGERDAEICGRRRIRLGEARGLPARGEIEIGIAFVQELHVDEADGSPIGLFLGDFHTRESKNGGAWMNNLVDQNHLLGQLAVVCNNANLVRPAAGEVTLMAWDDVITLFHEFGHTLHGLLSDVRYPSKSGTNTPRDFVEYPSQVNEMWALEPSLLRAYAVHHETGEPLPSEWVDTLVSSTLFQQGYQTAEYLAAALLDQEWHTTPLAELPTDPEQLETFEAAALQRVGLAEPLVPPRYRSAYFRHSFEGGYDAGYYSYLWAEVLDADTAVWLRATGGLTRSNGERFRRRLLARGGSVDAMDSYRDYRGQEPVIDHLLERRGLTG